VIEEWDKAAEQNPAENPTQQKEGMIGLTPFLAHFGDSPRNLA